MTTFPIAVRLLRRLGLCTCENRQAAQTEADDHCPLGRAIVGEHHLLVRGPTLQSEIECIRRIVNDWQRRRDEWHARMDDRGVDIEQIVKTVNGAPVKKGVYAFRSGPLGNTLGIRQMRDGSAIGDESSGILAVGIMDRSHFALVNGTQWTLIGCAGGGRRLEMETIEVQRYDDVARERS